MHTIVLADGGGPEAMAALPWLRQASGATVVTVTVDLGQDRDFEAVRDRAVAAGAARAHVVDRRAAFARDFLLPALKADAELPAPAWSQLAWPLLAQALVDIAVMEGATAVAHGCSATSEGGVHLELALRALGPDLMVMATAPDEPQGASSTPTPSRPQSAPVEAACVDLAFARGVPAALNGIEMPLEELLASLGTISGAYAPGHTPGRAGAGPAPHLPAVAAVGAAHLALRRQVTDRRLDAVCDLVAREYAAIIADGQWFSPMRRALDGFADEVQARITGTVRVRLSAGGDFEHVAITSPFARPAAGRRAPDARVVEGQSIAR